MSPGNDNQIDWTAASTPAEGVVPSLSRRPPPRAQQPTKHNVMDTLLGESKLTALDSGGSDPYNATGRQFRR